MTTGRGHVIEVWKVCEWYATIIKEQSIKVRCASGKTCLTAFLFDLNRKILSMFSFTQKVLSTDYFHAGLSLRAGGRGFSPATKRVAPGYFYWKIEEK